MSAEPATKIPNAKTENAFVKTKNVTEVVAKPVRYVPKVFAVHRAATGKSAEITVAAANAEPVAIMKYV